MIDSKKGMDHYIITHKNGKLLKNSEESEYEKKHIQPIVC